ncbi:uncharacterized protein [Diabrotica undecimpunctata]|uniref:uncharacterized protein n=1 Tax=Diabrotica undecimpunctata TaxID=50387 RepID=UPI003B63A497
MVDVHTKSGITRKSSTIVGYNSVKSYIDVSDQKGSYDGNPIRRSIKWYRKFGIELLTNTALVNALILYNKALNKKMDGTQFREELVTAICEDNNVTKLQQTHHRLEEYNKRGRCVICYSTLTTSFGRALETHNVYLQ